jgi:hypothetical protein
VENEWMLEINAGALFAPYQHDPFVQEMLTFSLDGKTWGTLSPPQKDEFITKVSDSYYIPP